MEAGTSPARPSDARQSDAWQQGSFRFLAGYVLALATAQVLCIGFSLAHVVLAQPLAILIVVAAIAAGVWYSVKLRRDGGARSAEPRRPLPVAFAAAVFGIAGAVYLLSWIAALAKPDLSWDGNSYHVPMMHLWARRGYIHWIAFDYDPGPEWNWLFHWLFNGYPKGAETISFLLARACGSSHPVNTNNLVFLPLGVAAVAVTSRSLGASRLAAWGSGAALGLVPVIVGQGVTSYVDASLGAAIAAVVGCTSVVFPAVHRGRLPWAALPALAASVGVAAAAKSSGLAPALLSIGLIVVGGGIAVWRTPREQRRRAASRQLAFAGALALGAFAVTGYWYVRSWVHTGNPLSPVRVALLGHEIFPGVPMKDSISEDALTPDFMQTWPSWKRVAFTWTQGGLHLRDLWHQEVLAWASTEHHWPRSIRWYDAHDGGLGYLWMLACVPAILLAIAQVVRARLRRRTEAPPVDVLLPMLFIVGVSFAVVPMNWWSRYTMWVHAAGLPCLALAIDRIATLRLRATKVAAAVWLASCVAIASFEALYQVRYTALQGGFLALDWQVEYTPSGIWHALVWYDHPKYFYENMSELDKEVATHGDPVALGSMEIIDGPLLGQLSMPIGLRDLVFLSRDIANDEPRLRALLEQHHVRYIYWRDDEYTPLPILHVASRQDRVMGYWRVFEVGPPSPVALGDIRAK